MKLERPTAAFALTLVAGIGILLMAVSWWGWGPHQGVGSGMMGGWMSGRGVLALPGPWVPWMGVAAGILVLGGAVGSFARPSTAPTWGSVVVVAVAANLLVGLGGFFASALGIVGGVLMALHPVGSE